MILCTTIGGAGVSTLVGSVSPELCAGDVCSTLGVALGFSGGLETGLHVVLGLTTVFPQLLQIFSHNWDVTMSPLSLQQPERCNQQKT